MEKKESVISRMLAAFTKVQEGLKEGGELPTDLWLKACSEVGPIYDVLFGEGWISGILKGDITNSCKTIEDRYTPDTKAGETIQSLIRTELKARGGKLEMIKKDKTSACIGVLWCYRALQFLTVWIKHFSEEKVDTAEVTSLTYNEVLRPYHGFVTRGVVGNVMRWTPDRKTLLERFGVSNEEGKSQMTALLVVLQPLMTTYLNFLNEVNINFPDTV